MKKRISTRTISQIAAFIALEIVLNRFCSFNTMGLKIGFAFVPIALCAMLYGPWWAAVAGALSDIVGANLFPLGPYFPGFTVVAAMMGAVYGLFLYKKDKPRFFPDILSPTLINCLLGLFLNTVWLSIIYTSKGYWGWFVYRLPEYAVLVPVHLIILPLLPRLAGAMRKAGIVKQE